MSNLLEQLKKDTTTALKTNDVIKRNVLKVVVGEVEMSAVRQNKNVSDDMIVASIKKLIENNTFVINTNKARNVDDLNAENAILASYLPKTASLEAVIAHLEPLWTQIKEHKNIGQATGLVMKTFKAASLPVDSKAVIEIINKIRG